MLWCNECQCFGSSVSQFVPARCPKCGTADMVEWSVGSLLRPSELQAPAIEVAPAALLEQAPPRRDELADWFSL